MSTSMASRTRYPVHVEEIDSQHGYFFMLLDYFERALAAQTDVYLPALANELAHYARFHFASEEALMRTYGYDSAGHLAAHATLLDRLTSMREEQDLNPADLKRFLYEWLVNHIQTEDVSLGKFIMAKRQEILGKFPET